MATLGACWSGTSGKVWYAPPYNIEKYIQVHLPKADAHRFGITPPCLMFTVRIGYEEWRCVFVGWHNIEVFAVPPARRGEVFVLASAW